MIRKGFARVRLFSDNCVAQGAVSRFYRNASVDVHDIWCHRMSVSGAVKTVESSTRGPIGIHCDFCGPFIRNRLETIGLALVYCSDTHNVQSSSWS